MQKYTLKDSLIQRKISHLLVIGRCIAGGAELDEQ